MIALALLLAQASIPAPVPVAPPAASAKESYANHCTLCHGKDGQGHTKKGRQLHVPSFKSARWQQHTTDKEIVDIVTDGNEKAQMPAFKDKLSPVEIQALVPYVRALGGRK